MKKIYFVGDIINNTGPAIVNKSYYSFLKDKVIFCKSNNKVLRTVHFLFNFLDKKIVIISGFSSLNYFLAKIAKKLNKKTIYIMHGYIKNELKYKKNPNLKKEKIEYLLLECVDKVICVSSIFAEFIKKELPEFNNKIDFVNNGIIEAKPSKDNKKDNQYIIISVGGGMSIKRNINICKAIKKLNRNDIKFIVIGKSENDGEKIKEYPFVEYYENLDHNEVLLKMTLSNLYIQNSDFETFGLAVVEAIDCGCDLLISKNVGALCVLENITEDDIIYNNSDIYEIARKIESKIKNSNKSSIFYDKEKCSWKNRSIELLEKIGSEK